MDRGKVPNGLDTALDHEVSYVLGGRCGNGNDSDMNAHAFGKIYQPIKRQDFLATLARADNCGITIKRCDDVKARVLKPLVTQKHTSQVAGSD